jgi:hypothetical protein
VFAGTVLFLGGCVDSESGNSCKKSLVAQQGSIGGTYFAKINEIRCNENAEISFELYIEKLQGKSHDWRIIVPLENDQRSESPPALSWKNDDHLQAIIRTRTLSGTLTEHVGERLVLERTYVPSDPDAFPNFH